VPNIIVELKAEITRVKKILTRLDGPRRVEARKTISYADQNLCRNVYADMRESLEDLRAIQVKPESSP